MRKIASFCGSETNTNYWKTLSASELTEEEIKLFKEQLDWKELSRKGSYTTDFWEEMKNYVSFKELSFNKQVPYLFLVRYSNQFDWDAVSMTFPFTKEQALKQMNHISTIQLYYHNPIGRALFKDEEWKGFAIGHSIMFQKSDDDKQTDLIETQLLSQSVIEEYVRKQRAFFTTTISALSKYHALTYNIAQCFHAYIENKELETRNAFHTLTSDEILQLRIDVTKGFERRRKDLEKNHWLSSVRRFQFTKDYIDKHRKDMGELAYSIANKVYEDS